MIAGEEDPRAFSSAFARVLGLVTALGLASLVVIPIYKAINADGRVTYCYTDSMTYSNPVAHNVVVYALWGHREWRSDRVLAQNLSDLESAKAAAAAYGCELR